MYRIDTTNSQHNTRPLLGDPQYRASFLSPPLCPHLSTFHFTVITPSLCCPHPSTVSSLSTRHHFTAPVIVTSSSSPFPHHTVILVSVIPFFSVFAYIPSVILLTSLFSSFMVLLLFINPDISASLFIYLPFPSRDPHLFLLGYPAR